MVQWMESVNDEERMKLPELDGLKEGDNVF